MIFIQKLCFSNQTDEALELYKRAFGCKERCLLHYSDAVKNGWEEPNAEREQAVYHSEIMFGEQEVRMYDSTDETELRLTREVRHAVGFDTEDEVRHAFAVLSEEGEIVQPLVKPPYMVIIGSVKDKYGLIWELMCDF